MIYLRLPADERGIALPMALFVLLILLGLSAAILATGTSETAISTNHVRGTQALYVSEAGLEDAFNTIRVNGMPATAVSWTTVPSLAGPGSDLTAFGTYTVQYMSAGSNTIVVRSIGTSGIGSATRTLRAVLTNNFNSADAVRTKDALTVQGSAQIRGGCGSTHSNGNLTDGGTQSTLKNATASGSYTAGGFVGGLAAGGMPTKPIPSISTASFLTTAKATKPAGEVWQLMSDGRVLNGSDVLLDTVADGVRSGVVGWTYMATSCDPGVSCPGWKRENPGTSSHGTFYVQGTADIRGMGGTWTTSVLATGDILYSGVTNSTPHLQDTWMVSDKDIRISGGGGVSGAGLIGAREHIQINGSTTLNGYIIAEGAATTSSTVTANLIEGSAFITYNCGLNPPLTGVLTILSWGY